MSMSVGSEVQFEAGEVGFDTAVVKLDSDNAIIFYEDTGDSNKAKGVHADLTTDPPTIGTPAVLSSAANNSQFDTCKLTSTTALLAWNENGTHKVVVASLSGSTVSFGTAQSAGTTRPGLAALTSTNAILVYGASGVVLNISGTSITVQTPKTIESGASNTDVVALTSSTALVTYQDSSSFDFRARILTSITTSTFTVNTEYTVDSAYTFDNAAQGYLDKLDSATAVAAYQADNASFDQVIKAVAMSVSGTVITPGTPVELTSGAIYDEYPVIAPGSSGQFAICYDDTVSNYIRSISVSGTTVTDNNDESTLAAAAAGNQGLAGDASSLVLVAYSDNGSVDGQARLLSFSVPPQLYTGTNTVTYRSDLPSGITDIKRGALLVRSDLTTVVIGSAVSNSVMLAQATSADTYGTWTDITDSHPTDEGITAVVEI